jgi:tungstate transport system permease protein
MSDLGDAFATALRLLLTWDAELAEIVGLSLEVSAAALLLAAVVGLPLGAWIGIASFPGRRGVVAITNALFGLPAVVVGLVVWVLLSRAGPLGSLGLLFTPSAMVIAQTVLITPLVVALTRQLMEDLHAEYGEQLRAHGAGTLRAVPTLLFEGRFALATVLLAAFGRALSAVGAVIIVGGNIAHVTRVMPTAIALETSRGEVALALGLGILLLGISLCVAALAEAAREVARRAGA